MHGDIRHAEQDPKKFYEGFDTGWGCVVQRLDLRRKYVDEVVYQAFMEMPTDTAVRLFVLRGPGGSGKTVALKRIAWEAATQLNECPVLWFEQDGALLPEHVMELYGLTDKRVFVFVDRLALHTDRVMALLSTCKKQRVPVTVIGAERDSEWNVYCSALDRWNPIFTRVPNLSTQDVEGLIDLLERHRCLGLLTGRPRQEQIDAFMKTAERQLLVALHEATHGRKLEDIVFGEYNDVTPEQARRLYLDIATMHQFAVPVRAGTISRVSGVRFNDYETKFLKPLENVVITGQDAHTGDHNYRARHSRIASLVFNQACPSDEEKADQLIRIIGGLDPGYSVDSHALLEITRGRNLSKTMVGAEPGRDVYRAASKAAPEMGFIDQQWAIFEANHSGGSLSEAEMLAKRARSKDRGSSSIIHTQAEIARRRANVEHSELLKEQFRRQARDRLSEMRPASSVLTASSRCKLLVDEVADLSETIDDTASAADLSFFADKVKEAEKALDRATASYAGDPDIADTEARLLTVINEKRAATRALERAWSLNPRGGRCADAASVCLCQGWRP
ncbi:hypothetical protein [Methylobacterium sp. WL120]|uniref:P-loop NTPase n=1 Tax=Methylobacterium sp. WL120 TaxID=2603887 RepID=UPI0011CB1CBC|nr:hypothetical protein [Methylobacterium sp. WL120]TXM60453.1 hypothetical protein FV229_24075 [Methylobacterium sp. WL120]